MARPGAAARDLAGETVLVTAGPTVEDIDPVRFVSNRSSGPHGVPPGRGGPRPRRPRDARLRPHRAAPRRRASSSCACARPRRWRARWRAACGGATIVAMAAAVSDYRPAAVAPDQDQEGGRGRAPGAGAHARHPALRWARPRAGGSWSASRPRRTPCARTRGPSWRDKSLDLIVANDVAREGRGLRGGDQRGRAHRRGGARWRCPSMSKRELAERIWDRVDRAAADRGTPGPARRRAPRAASRVARGDEVLRDLGSGRGARGADGTGPLLAAERAGADAAVRPRQPASLADRPRQRRLAPRPAAPACPPASR